MLLAQLCQVLAHHAHKRQIKIVIAIVRPSWRQQPPLMQQTSALLCIQFAS